MNNPPTSSFLYVSCQHGAESVIKPELSGPTGPFRLAYSSKGFLTFKGNFPTPIWSTAVPESPLIRSRGHVLDRVEGTESEPMIDAVLNKISAFDWDAIHVWQRDIAQPGWNGFEPGQTALAKSVADLIRTRLAAQNDNRASQINRQEKRGSKVIEVIIDEPNRWWIAAKHVQNLTDGWPGGIFEIDAPDDMISRAYLKIAEAMAWARWQFQPNERVIEIGSSPGGACQFLLDRGAKVVGVDPAEMDERIASHPNFEHWRSRAIQLKRRLFRGFRYLVCDANVAPNYTLDTIEAIVTYPTSRFRSLLLTIKLSSWDKAVEIPEHLERVRSWGFDRVQARQLSHNRREYCLSATRTKARPTYQSEEESRAESEASSGSPSPALENAQDIQVNTLREHTEHVPEQFDAPELE